MDAEYPMALEMEFVLDVSCEHTDNGNEWREHQEAGLRALERDARPLTQEAKARMTTTVHRVGHNTNIGSLL